MVYICSQQHYSQKQNGGSDPVSINESMNKQNGENMCNGIKFTLKKEGNSNTRCNTDELLRHYAR